MQTDGLEITELIYKDLKTPLKVRILNHMTLNVAKDFLTMQYIIVSRMPYKE